jgi:hypothetical protein
LEEAERWEKRRMSSLGGVCEARYEEVRRRAEKCFKRGGVLGTEIVAIVVGLEVIAAVVVVSARGFSEEAAAASSSSNVHAPLSGWSRSTRVCSASV